MAESAIAGYTPPPFRFGDLGSSLQVARSDIVRASVTGPGVATTPARSDVLTAILTAKGAILLGGASSTVGALTVGADGTVLQADSTQTLGAKWTALAGPGTALTPAHSDILTAAFAVTQSGVTNQPVVQCSPGPVSVTTTAGGNFTVTYPANFPTACDALVITNSDDVTHPNILLAPADTGGALGRGSTVCRAWQANTGAVLNAVAIKYVYVAFGH